MAGAAGRRGFARRVGRLVASGGGLDEKTPVVNELTGIFDTTYFELSRNHEFLGLVSSL